MGNLSCFLDIVEQQLLELHTAYLAKVLEISDDLKIAKIQPLGLYKEYGKKAQKHAPLLNVPVANSARYKLETIVIEYVKDVQIKTEASDSYLTSAALETEKQKITVVTPEKTAPGDVVLCVCCDRDITQAKNGANTLPPPGHHSLENSVVIGVIN